jgi:NAD(P)-dependent dehydrogenase (short-subunit alcohol dehydrogenase family)
MTDAAAAAAPPSGGGALEERVILVTGASRGLGRALALGLAAEGAHLVLVARTVGALEELDDLQRPLSGRPAVLVPQDLADHEAIDRLGGALYQRFGRLDGLVAAAATVAMLSPVAHQDPKGWERTMALNLTANFRLIRSLEPLLRQSAAGRAVFVTDRTGRDGDTLGRAYWNPYAASKAALETLVRGWAGELRQTPVRANLVAPPPFRSKLRAFCFPGEDPARLPAPEDLAPAILPLLRSDCARHGEIVAL